MSSESLRILLQEFNLLGEIYIGYLYTQRNYYPRRVF